MLLLVGPFGLKRNLRVQVYLNSNANFEKPP